MIKGSVDSIDNHRIRGWCFDPHKIEDQLTVELFIDGKKIAEQKANLTSTEIDNCHYTNCNCAFDFPLPQSIGYEGQAIEVKANDEIIKSKYSCLLGANDTFKINRIQIYGERASGTNFLKQLLEKNIPDIEHTNQYGWKHFFPPETFPNSDDCLFIVIYRNPFDWIRSIHLQPHHAHQSLHEISFSQFIRTEWLCVWDEMADVLPGDEKYYKEMMFERNPVNGERFENVIKLRNAKIRAFESLKTQVKHIEYIRYEDLCKEPEKIIKEIAFRYGLPSKDLFENILTYKGITTIAFRPKIYKNISVNDLKFILSNLDRKTESMIGYSLCFSREFLRSFLQLLKIAGICINDFLYDIYNGCFKRK